MAGKTISVFKDLEVAPAQEMPQGNRQLNKVETLQVGYGSKVLRVDRDGIWLGAEKFADAPFSVDMEGNITATTLNLSGYLEVGEALGDIGAGNITGTYIANGAIITSKLAANAVTASKIDVNELSAISADIGSVTSGTITGALIRTSSSGDRVEIDDTDDSIKIYDSGDLRLELYQDRITFYENDGVSDVVSFYASPTGNFLMAGTSSNDLLMSSQRDFTVSAVDDLYLFGNDTINLNTAALADDIYIGLGGNTFMQFGDGRVYMDTYFDMQGFDINDVGTLTCVTLVETSDIRTKKNVKKLGYGLKEVLQLDPIQYQFKDRENKSRPERRLKHRDKVKEPMSDTRGREEKNVDQLGFSAQDVFKIIPEVTKYADQDGEETARLYTTQLVPVLVRAIQELHAEVESLKKNGDNPSIPASVAR